MRITFNEKLIAYLALISGLSISAVAVYYSVVGLTAIFAAAAVPIIIMGAVLEISKLVATVWLKQNWKIAPMSVRGYLLAAIVVLMLITSMGIFGFLSKAHSDQNLVSGDVLAKISVYDEKIKTAKENIDANRKALKQMDEAVDQVMGRSQDEKGADKAVALRRGQAKERTRLLSEITAEQKVITQLSEERAPIAAEVRKVEAEVGPLKYIAAFVYGDTDQTVLEKAVVWVILLIVVVFDPLAVILLLASQISFQNFRERLAESDVMEVDSPIGTEPVINDQDPTVEKQSDPHPVGWMFDTGPETHPYLYKGDFWKKPEGWESVGPLVAPADKTPEPVNQEPVNIDSNLFVQNEEQTQSNLWSSTVENISQDDYVKTAQEKLEQRINALATLVREGRMDMSEVPENLISAVKAKV